MYNLIDFKRAAELEGKEISVRDFLATDWTDHVFLIPDDYRIRGYGSVPVTNTREDSEHLLREKYIDHMGVYIIREKDFGPGAIAHWVYFGVIVPRSEFEAANIFRR